MSDVQLLPVDVPSHIHQWKCFYFRFLNLVFRIGIERKCCFSLRQWELNVHLKYDIFSACLLVVVVSQNTGCRLKVPTSSLSSTVLLLCVAHIA